MNREEFEHAIRASCDLLGVSQVIIVGSQAILAQFPNAPRELRGSTEADVWTEELTEDQVAKLNSIGMGSLFHNEHGFYIDPVGPRTALLSPDWRDRAIRVDIPERDASGVSPEVHDLVVSKLARGEEKDTAFCASVYFHRMARLPEVRNLVSTLPVAETLRTHILTGLQAAEARSQARRHKQRRGP
jgi:hypothetical protein